MLFACILQQIVQGANMAHLVNKSLPGIDPSLMRTNWYSGSCKVARNRGLNYLFIESERDKTKDPIIIQMNGSPGWASILLALQALGPVVTDGKDFFRNEKSWCRNSSLLLIDSPAGVGFSYGKRDQDMTANDLSNSIDMPKLMLQFYSDFPEYKTKPLYISGIS